MLLAFFAYHRLIFLQHANVSKHFRQTFLHAFVPLYHLCQGRLLSVVQHLVDAVSQHLSVISDSSLVFLILVQRYELFVYFQNKYAIIIYCSNPEGLPLVFADCIRVLFVLSRYSFR